MPAASSTLWDDVLGQVRMNYPDIVRGWFSDLCLVSLESGMMQVRAANMAQIRYLQKHARGPFTEAAQAATGRLVAVSFEAESTTESNLLDSDDSYLVGDDLTPLNPDCTFDSFVTGPCNRLAHAAAVAVAENPGRSYNPFFVHGPVGLGKTHLLQAICHAAIAREPDLTLYYLSCETFINHFMEAVERGALHRFRYRYRHARVLVIDDIQFLAERERSQEEFFHTFNTLSQSQRQIILSADCSPSEIPSLEERLVSRFNSGLVALIDRPCLETRMAIVRKKAKLRCIEVPEEVVHLVASRIDTNIRELEGALIKMDALSQGMGGSITRALAIEALGPAPAPTHPVNIQTVLEVVSKHYHVRIPDLQGKSRAKAITQPRHVCMYIARQLTTLSLEQIGGYFGNRDHSTVLHASRSIGRLMQEDTSLTSLLDEIASDVKNATY